MKRILSALLFFVLLLGAACPAFAEPVSAAEALLEQIDAWLIISEQAYAIDTNAYRLILDFCKQRDYSTLLCARIAVDQAQRELMTLSAPGMTMADEVMLELIGMDVETDSLEAELQRFDISLLDMPGIMLMFESMMYSTLLNSSEVDIMSQFAATELRCAELIMEYQCALVNYILLPAADQPQVAAFWESIPARYPTLGSYQMPWETEPDALNDHFIQIDQAYSEQVSLSSELYGRFSYANDQYNRRLQQMDMDALKSNVLIIDGMPRMVPLPDGWLYPDTSEYWVSAEASGTQPSVVVLTDSDVTLDAFNTYISELLELGATVYSQEESAEEGVEYVLNIGGHLLMLDWFPDNTVMVGYKSEYLSLEYFDYILCCR